MSILTTGPCFTAELNLPANKAAVASTFKTCAGTDHAAGDAIPTCAEMNTAIAAATPAAQTLSIAGQTLSLSGGGGSVAVPSTVFATPAETIAGTATDLIVNPADLYARENILAQTGLGLVLSAIPAPAANQSPWGTNTLGETLHYMPGVGWKIVADLYGITGSGALAGQSAGTAARNVAYLTMPRAGRVTISLAGLALANATTRMYGNVVDYLYTYITNPAGIQYFDGMETPYYNNCLSNASGAFNVLAGDVISLVIDNACDGACSYNMALVRF